jgi:hypothetical protein
MQQYTTALSEPSWTHALRHRQDAGAVRQTKREDLPAVPWPLCTHGLTLEVPTWLWQALRTSPVKMLQLKLKFALFILKILTCSV